jgi:hypothetical protein
MACVIVLTLSTGGGSEAQALRPANRKATAIVIVPCRPRMSCMDSAPFSWLISRCHSSILVPLFNEECPHRLL